MTSLAPPASGPRLRDIHLPPAPPWWPPAPGWWVLAAVLVLALAGLAWWWRRRRLQARRGLRVLVDVDGLRQRHEDQPAVFAAEVHQLLRRTARRFDPAAAHAQGAAWQAILAQVPVDASVLARLERLDHALYRPESPDVEATAAAARIWLTRAWRMKAPRRRMPKAVAHA